MKRFLLILFLVLIMIGSATVSATDRTFSWDQNTESDLKGYKAYRATAPDVQAIPANLWLTIWRPGENPDTSNLSYIEYTINGENRCEIIMNVIPDGTYYFVWTAFDNNGNESLRSNEVSTIIDDTAPAPPGGLQCN